MTEANRKPTETKILKDVLNYQHIGEVLRKEFLKPMKLSPKEASKRLGWSAYSIGALLHHGLSLERGSAEDLARVFETTPEFWLDLSKKFILESVRRGLADAKAGRVSTTDEAKQFIKARYEKKAKKSKNRRNS
jgi:addiction module HigA family antidote